MKKFCSILLLAVFLFSVVTLSVSAERETYNWYCKHVSGHVQPQSDPALSFVEELDGYYLDHRHTSHTEGDRVVYLTFDAGYENGNVAKILDTLKEEQVSAAFFILENLIRHDTALVCRMADEGHLVCNHTLRHKDMSGFDDAAFLEELRALEALYTEQTGRTMAAYFRPPEGKFSRENLACAKENGYKTVFWSFAYPDWSNEKQPDPTRAKAKILENVHNGAVLLLHPTSATNAAILGDVISELKAQGYRFGTLDELTGAEA